MVAQTLEFLFLLAYCIKLIQVVPKSTYNKQTSVFDLALSDVLCVRRLQPICTENKEFVDYLA